MRLLKALLNGEPPPVEEDGDEEEDDDEAYPVNESGAKQEAAPAKAEEAGAAAPAPAAKAAPAAEAAQVAELTSKLQTLSFSTAGELPFSNPEPEAEPLTLPTPSWASLPLQPTPTP